MNDIKTVGVVGLGALGTLFAHLLTRGCGRENVLVLADRDRIRRYEAEGVYFNGARCDFNYTAAEDCTQKPDLLLFAVKFGALDAAIRLCRHLVTPETTLVSVLNGVTSEQVLGNAFSPEQVVWCVAQKMSAVKEGNHAAADPLGELAVGVPAELDRRHLDRLTAFFGKLECRKDLVIRSRVPDLPRTVNNGVSVRGQYRSVGDRPHGGGRIDSEPEA